MPSVACVYKGWISLIAPSTTPTTPTTPTLPSALSPSATAHTPDANRSNPGIEDGAARHASGVAAIIGGAAGGGAVFLVLLIVGVYYKAKGKTAAAAAARKQPGDGGGTYTNVIYQEGDGEIGEEDEDDALLNLNCSDDADDDALITV